MSRVSSVAAGVFVLSAVVVAFLDCPHSPRSRPAYLRADFEEIAVGSDREGVSRRFGQPARFATGTAGGWGYERLTADEAGEADALTWVWFDAETGKVVRVSYGEPGEDKRH